MRQVFRTTKKEDLKPTTYYREIGCNECFTKQIGAQERARQYQCNDLGDLSKFEFLDVEELPELVYVDKYKTLPFVVTHVKDLIYYDGPLLSHLVDLKGEPYLAYWCDTNELYNRWLYFRVPSSKLQEYLENKLALDELMFEDGQAYVLDVDWKIQPAQCLVVDKSALPDSYFPLPKCYHDAEGALVVHLQ